METTEQQRTAAKVDTRRVAVFLGLAFGIAWLTGLVVYLTGGLSNSKQIAPGISLALVLLAVPYMWAPGIANLLTRFFTREGWKNMGLRPHFRKGWLFWLIGWVTPGLLTIFGGAVFFLLYPRYFDANLEALRQGLARTPSLSSIPAWLFVVIEAVGVILISPIANFLATLGEELGWRAYLLPKFMPLGWRKATLLLGAIWGLWHWPVIFMGYEYGSTYPGHPWIGPLLFVWIAFCFGIFLSWITLRGGSVWPAVIGHAAINGIAAIAVITLTGTPNPLLGPLPVGIIGAIGYEALALILYFSPLGEVNLPAAKESMG
ncbi:MAG TPA: CPBP family intramembrane glutamic endopeptidase [Anaerolineales bacterium]|nr:CPBP family intramembrane glutamic endopeptidase [Anaerolineales bacterium]